MPTYDYVCTKCGHELEIFQSMKDDPLKKCPACKKQGLKRLLGSGAGLIFKGSGFYITDYKKKSGTPDAAKSGGEKAGGEKSAPAKSESKAAAK
ncbi:MAG: zinc ribbon domain-containing protein [Opitutaceae bacterium]|nr:zinc ribbon domain-containing protein [Opitutaceae bacterium]